MENEQKGKRKILDRFIFLPYMKPVKEKLLFDGWMYLSSDRQIKSCTLQPPYMSFKLTRKGLHFGNREDN